LGARLDVVETLDGLMQGADRDLVKIWQKMNAKRFDNIMLKTKTVSARALPEGIEVTFAAAEEGGTAPAPQVYDLVLQAVGRTPNGKKISADKAGVAVTDRGFINPTSSRSAISLASPCWRTRPYTKRMWRPR
jgi:dihydrolipoamide dehydrogenase